MPATKVVWDEVAFAEWVRNAAGSPQRAVYMMAVRITVAMKAAIPVSKVQPVYATGGATVPGGTRYAGDFPLRPSGYLRKSVRRYREPGGDWIIGPTAEYAAFVNDGTPPHEIRSTGSWPLRNRATGQVFGPKVHHPGTRGVHYLERSLDAIGGVTVHVL
jgi:hypothetical protein